MRTPRHVRPLWAGISALLLLTGVPLLPARPAAAAVVAVVVPAARVHALGLPGFPDLGAANKPVVGITAMPSGGGYWLVASDGGIFGAGGAPFFGSTGGTPLNRPVVGMAATPTGNGYWLVASDGGIFAYGDAAFFGSTGGARLNRPVVGMAPSASGQGYWLVGGDGGIFGFGDALGFGSVPGTGASVGDVVGMGRSTGGSGYVVAARNGRVWAFGDAPFQGSATVGANRAVVGVTTTGAGYWLADVDVPVAPSVGPPLPPGAGDGRRIVYCVSCQRVWYAEADGSVVKSNLVSGRVGTPRPGTYFVYSKSRLASSGSVTMEYMVRFAFGRSAAIGFHAIPRTASHAPIQTEQELGSYRSHGCVRQADRDAVYTWNFAPLGTKVVVTA